MTPEQEEKHGIDWRKMAWDEGHRKGRPPSISKELDFSERRDELVQLLKERGPMFANEIGKHVGRRYHLCKTDLAALAASRRVHRKQFGRKVKWFAGPQKEARQ